MCPNPNCIRDNSDNAQTCANCGEPLRGLVGQNTMLEGRYQMTRVLGCGGMGAVYLAEDTRIPGRRVAVKENLNITPQAQSQFQAEVSLMVGLDHPGLPKVSDQFTGPTGRQYLVMDYVEGETLEDVVDQRGPLPEGEAITLAERLLDVLEYLHNHAVIHRDVKPANVKLTPENKPVLVDFGIAKLHAPGHGTQTAAQGVGSPGFAPIEQYGTGTDARSDLYSLGAVMYYLLTGQAPPEAPDLATGTPLPMPRNMRPDLSQHAQRVIFKAMALNPEQRYQSAVEMRQALLGPTGSPVSAPPSVTKIWLWITIGGIGTVLTSIALALLVLVVLGRPTSVPTHTPTAWRSVTSPSPPSTVTPMVARVTSTTATPASTTIPMPDDIPPTGLPTLTSIPLPMPPGPGGLVAYTAGPEGTWQIFMAKPTNGETWLLPGQLPNSGVPAWSPDGSRIAFRSNNSDTWQVYAINADGTGLRQLTYGGNNNMEAAWSPNGMQIAFVSDRDGNKEIYVMDSDGGNQRRLTVNPGWDDDPSWSPDGRWLVFESKREGRMDIYKIQLDGSNLVRLTSDGELNSTPAWSPDGELIAFERKSGSIYHIWIMNADGGSQWQLTSDGKRNLRPAWSPDVSEIAYTSDRDGVEAIWITSLDRSSPPRRLSRGGGFDPAWSRR